MTHLPALVDRAAANASGLDNSPIVRIQKILFSEAAALGASDIHIEPCRGITQVRCRVDGAMRPLADLPRWLHDNLVVRIKVLAGLDVADRRAPQDGHIDAESAGGGDARVATVPTRWGEKVVIRLLQRGRRAPTLSQLGFPSVFEERLQSWIRRSHGMLFVAGPTGSGKTTTLYALIQELRGEPLNIVTIEDPIEYEMEGITQIQVQEKSGLTFARALRAILRQDPDVILVGEIRDGETARTAVQAAMTGHLVLSTLHATDSASAILRLADLGASRSDAAGVLLGVIAQRLLRLNCPDCAEPDDPRPLYADRLGIPRSEAGRFRRSRGCSACAYGGSRGRVGMFELLEMSGRIREACAGAGLGALRRLAEENGMMTLRGQAASMAAAGAVSVAEAYRFGYFGEP